MAAATFLTRVIGLAGAQIHRPWALRAIALVPVAAFAVLVSASLEVQPNAWFRWAIVGLGGWLSWRGAPTWAAIGVGLAAYLTGTALFR
jgi:hypothetical protein